MKKHEYIPYLCTERFAGEYHLDYFKCCNCGHIVYKDPRNKEQVPSQHSPYWMISQDINNIEDCNELIMTDVLQ